jgi:bifunctional DNase/RNase
MVGKQPIVLLKTLAGNRFLPIWIGHPEAAAILMRLQEARPPRPATHDLMCSMLEALGAEVTQVSITDLRDNTFFAEVTVSNGIDEYQLDSRPSDALALAVRAEAPIYASEQIVVESGIEFEQEAMGDTDEMVEKFRDFLEGVSPEDFMSQEN